MLTEEVNTPDKPIKKYTTHLGREGGGEVKKRPRERGVRQRVMAIPKNIITNESLYNYSIDFLMLLTIIAHFSKHETKNFTSNIDLFSSKSMSLFAV